MVDVLEGWAVPDERSVFVSLPFPTSSIPKLELTELPSTSQKAYDVVLVREGGLQGVAGGRGLEGAQAGDARAL